MDSAEYTGSIKYRISEEAKEKARAIAEYRYWTKIRRFTPEQYSDYLTKKHLKRLESILRQIIETGEIK